MPLYLTQAEADEIWSEDEKRCTPIVSPIGELQYRIPPKLGRGFIQEIDLEPGCNLCIIRADYHDRLTHYRENLHLVQFASYLSGTFDSGEFVVLDRSRGYIGGSGIQPSHQVSIPSSEPVMGIDVHIVPDRFYELFATPDGELPAQFKLLLMGESLQHRFSPPNTRKIRSLVSQIINCDLPTPLRKNYLHAKVMEFISLQLSYLFDYGLDSIKRSTIDCIYQAKRILDQSYKCPPTVSELAKMVDVSESTLLRVFKKMFNTTIVGYVETKRMEEVKLLLQDPQITITAAANQVGYNHMGNFSVLFKRKFGMCPKEWRSVQ